MSKPIPSSCSLNFVKIIFTIKKTLRYGQGLFVCGTLPELGSWRPETAFRLKWCQVRLLLSQGDVWTGTLLLTRDLPHDF
jgi:hypothetical protein